MFSETLLDHFRNPRHVGSLAPPAVTVRVENPVCGDILTLSATASGGVVREVGFKVRGCTAAIAAGSALAELVLDCPVDALDGIAPSDVEGALGGLPSASKHVARLASDAARALSAAIESERGG